MSLKVKTFWEGHKIWKKFPSLQTKQLFLLRSVKKSGKYFKIFVAFSEKLNFKRYKFPGCGPDTMPKYREPEPEPTPATPEEKSEEEDEGEEEEEDNAPNYDGQFGKK